MVAHADEQLPDGRYVLWLTTQPSPVAHTHGADDGQVGWRRHAVIVPNGEHVYAATTRNPASCGMKPRYGWNDDLFIEQRCTRCDAALKKIRAKVT